MTSQQLYDNIETIKGNDEEVIALFNLFKIPVWGEGIYKRSMRADNMRKILLELKQSDIPLSQVIKKIKKGRKKHTKP